MTTKLKAQMDFFVQVVTEDIQDYRRKRERLAIQVRNSQ